jgi:surface protein
MMKPLDGIVHMELDVVECPDSCVMARDMWREVEHSLHEREKVKSCSDVFSIFDTSHLIRSDADIHEAVKAWCGDEDDECFKWKRMAAKAKYGHISKWDTSGVTNMRNLFRLIDNFNDDISQWDVSGVVDMSGMFYFCTNFNQNIERWNTCSVMDMTEMFYSAESFNQPLASWDVSNVQSMEKMFTHAISFNQGIGGWNVGKVRTMKEV